MPSSRPASALVAFSHGLGLSPASPQRSPGACWPRPGSPRGAEPRVGNAGPRAVVPVLPVLHRPVKQGWAQRVVQPPWQIVLHMGTREEGLGRQSRSWVRNFFLPLLKHKCSQVCCIALLALLAGGVDSSRSCRISQKPAAALQTAGSSSGETRHTRGIIWGEKKCRKLHRCDFVRA